MPSADCQVSGAVTILIVEDQDLVRKTAARILKAKGYTVLVASSSEEALSMMRNQNPALDLLLSDVIRPDLNGKELYQTLLTIQPDLCVLYMSGYTRDVISHHGVLDEGIDFIQKPLTVESLARKVKAVLRRRVANHFTQE